MRRQAQTVLNQRSTTGIAHVANSLSQPAQILAPVSGDLIEGAKHDIDKAKHGQPIIMTLQLDLVLVWRVVIHPLRPSTSTDLEGHPIAEDKPRTNNRQEEANAAKRCYFIAGDKLDQLLHDGSPL